MIEEYRLSIMSKPASKPSYPSEHPYMRDVGMMQQLHHLQEQKQRQQQQPQKQQEQLETKSKAFVRIPTTHVGERLRAPHDCVPHQEEKHAPLPRPISSGKDHSVFNRPPSHSTPDKIARPTEKTQRVTPTIGQSGPPSIETMERRRVEQRLLKPSQAAEAKTEEKQRPPLRTADPGTPLTPQLKWPANAQQQHLDKAAAKKHNGQPMTSAHATAHAAVTVRPENSKVATKGNTVLRQDEIEDLKRFHDSSLAASSRKAYLSDFTSFKRFLTVRFPEMETDELLHIQQNCTLEHVLAYLNRLCKDGKQISTINRRLSTIKKHILPSLFSKNVVPGSREEQVIQEVNAIIQGVRRTVGAEHRIRGKRPLLLENIIAMCDIAAEVTDEAGNAMPNTQCRDVALLLFLFFSAMRRNEVAHLLWSDLTFDQRGVRVLIRQSKTDKAGKGQTIGIPLLDKAKAAFCPVTALLAWKTKSGGAGESPVFRWISKKDEVQWRVLIDQRIVAIIKHYTAEIGLEQDFFAGHSTRSGYVTTASARGVPIAEMMKRTRHKCVNSISVYMKDADLFKGTGDDLL